MKRIVAACACVTLMFTMTGCAQSIDLTSSQEDMIAEYIAGELLEHSYESSWDYRKLQNAKSNIKKNGYEAGLAAATANTNNTSVTSQASGNSSVTNAASLNSASDVTQSSTAGAVQASSNVSNRLEDVLGISQASITTGKLQVGNRYPEGEFTMGVTAGSSDVIAAVEFVIVNSSNNNIALNTVSSGIKMELDVGNTKISKMSSALSNDISKLSNINLAPGESYTACAVFKVPKSYQAGLSDANILYGISGNNLGTIVLQK